MRVFKHWNSCPKRLWSLHTRRYSNLVWIWSWETCHSCPCSELGHWTRHPPPQGIRHLCWNLTRPRPGQDISPWVGIRVRPGEGKQGQTHPWDGQAGLWRQAEAGLGCGHMGGPGLARPMARESCRELETSPAVVTPGQGLTCTTARVGGGPRPLKPISTLRTLSGTCEIFSCDVKGTDWPPWYLLWKASSQISIKS